MGLTEREFPRPSPLSPVEQANQKLRLEAMVESLTICIHYAEMVSWHADFGDVSAALWSLNNFRLAANAACFAGREIRDHHEARKSAISDGVPIVDRVAPGGEA
jgi:hypothetical protein